jgi:hypothetical protein
MIYVILYRIYLYNLYKNIIISLFNKRCIDYIKIEEIDFYCLTNTPFQMIKKGYNKMKSAK